MSRTIIDASVAISSGLIHWRTTLKLMFQGRFRVSKVSLMDDFCSRACCSLFSHGFSQTVLQLVEALLSSVTTTLAPSSASTEA